MRSPPKPKETLNKVLPLRWSFGSKDHIKNPVQVQTGELVEYLESGRRPRCTKEPIITLVATPPQRNAQGRGFDVGNHSSSPSGSSLSCTDRTCSDTCYSPKIPTGQWRSISHGVCNSSNIKAQDYGSLRQRSSKRARQDQSRTLDLQFQLQRGAILDGHISYSEPPSRDSTLRNTKVHTGLSSKAQKDLLQMVLQPGYRKGQRGQEGRSHDSLLSFFKPAFKKKDIPASPLKGQDRHIKGHGQLGKLANSDSSKLSLSNGTLPTVALEERKASITANCDAHNCKVQLVNGQAGSYNPVDIKRAHSSMNIQTKLDLTFHRCSSLQRNGEVVAPPNHRILLADKPIYATLQRTRYSTTSLGRPLICH